jgi:hypothetical protein
MAGQKVVKNSKQKLYHDMVLGTLLYTVVLGFFNDYTKILHTGTYSITFALAIVMQLLTYLTFLLKDKVVIWFQPREGNQYKYGLVFIIWIILFFSKFVFLEVISIVFRQEVKISGFIGLILIIVCLTITQKIIELIDQKLEA